MMPDIEQARVLSWIETIEMYWTGGTELFRSFPVVSQAEASTNALIGWLLANGVDIDIDSTLPDIAIAKEARKVLVGKKG